MNETTTAETDKVTLSWKQLWSYFRLIPLPAWAISIDNFPVWREHVAWSKMEGTTTRDYMIQRFSSNMVFLSLLLATELGVLFSPSKPADIVRSALADEQYLKPEFWVGFILVFDVILTILAILSSFTSWAIISSLSNVNAHCIIRSTVGIYACMLPSRMLLASLYSFLVWVNLWMHVLMPRFFGYIVVVVSVIFLVHIVSVYSALGSLIIQTGAMGDNRVFTIGEEEGMMPTELTVYLIQKAYSLKQDASVSVYAFERYFTVQHERRSDNKDSEMTPPPPPNTPQDHYSTAVSNPAQERRFRFHALNNDNSIGSLSPVHPTKTNLQQLRKLYRPRSIGSIE